MSMLAELYRSDFETMTFVIFIGFALVALAVVVGAWRIAAAIRQRDGERRP